MHLRQFFIIKKLKIEICIFLLFFLTRYLFVIFLGKDNFELHADSVWYNEQSNEVLKGNFNLLRHLFITAPFFSYFQALIKFIFSGYWMPVFEFLQITIASISGIYLYKLSNQIFKKNQTATLSTILFCFYPMTIWWVGTFSPDIWFQSFLIIFFYYFLKSLEENSLKLLVISSLIFCLTFLTKSQILIFSIFIPIIILLKKNIYITRKLGFIFIFTAISLISTIPYGIYNLAVNGTYVLSSSGLGGTFITGNNNDAYLSHMKRDEITIEQKTRFQYNKYLIMEEIKPKIKNKTPKEIQKIYFSAGLDWIKKNPKKAIELKFDHAKRFFTPGISKYWHSFERWFVVLIITAPLYLFAYVSIFEGIKNNLKENFWILSLMTSMFIFTTVFYYSGRFIVITLEPYYIIFASHTLIKIKDKFLSSK
tara:strand:+ start:1439 stop:2707 length:1269 start_codon:yes stop_codon:yes gene_type:complete